MKASANSRRERVRAMLADLNMPGALEAVDDILASADSGAPTTSEAIDQLPTAQVELRNNRGLQNAMHSSRLPAVLGDDVMAARRSSTLLHRCHVVP